jgi:hypothetical protein
MPCECGADLMGASSVKREYINKRGKASVFAVGHYGVDECFVSENFDGFVDSDSYDLCDNSDSCMHCGEVI